MLPGLRAYGLALVEAVAYLSLSLSPPSLHRCTAARTGAHSASMASEREREGEREGISSLGGRKGTGELVREGGREGDRGREGR